MAIEFSPAERKPVNWFAIAGTILAIAFVLFAAYFLFFAPSPRIEVVLPEPLQDANLISTLDTVDASVVLNSPAFSSLQPYVGAPGVGSIGRANPFAPVP